MVVGVPRMCITTADAPLTVTTVRIAGSESPLTSLTRSAPAAMARRATSGLRVSMETGTGDEDANAFRTGPTRRHSSSQGTVSAPGRVDSPPMSMIAAPSETIWRARAIAASASAYRPPSENESGVTLRTPITRVRSPTTRLRWAPGTALGARDV